MVFRCPQCGKEYRVTDIPNMQTLFRCTESNCQKVFTIEQAKIVSAGDSAGTETEAENKQPSQASAGTDQFMHDSTRDAKALAQSYFSDILNENVPKSAPQASLHEEVSREEMERQRQQLFEYAQAVPEKEDLELMSEDMQRRQKIEVRIVREKKGQSTGCWLLLLLAAALLAGRILFTSTQATISQMTRMQPQLIPSILYFIAACILIFHLLRFTSKPQWVFAALLPIPLILDFWYLFPGLLTVMPSNSWFMINCGVKLFISLLSLLMGIRAARYPARKYRREEE